MKKTALFLGIGRTLGRNIIERWFATGGKGILAATREGLASARSHLRLQAMACSDMAFVGSDDEIDRAARVDSTPFPWVCLEHGDLSSPTAAADLVTAASRTAEPPTALVICDSRIGFGELREICCAYRDGIIGDRMIVLAGFPDTSELRHLVKELGCGRHKVPTHVVHAGETFDRMHATAHVLELLALRSGIGTTSTMPPPQ